MKILTAQEMGAVDRQTTELYHIPSLLLMESAGRSVAEEIVSARPDALRNRVLILCGRGNNGGDGFVAARYLALKGGSPAVVLVAEPSSLKGDARQNWDIACRLGIPIETVPDPERVTELLDAQPAPAVVVDALFGTGLSKPLNPGYRKVVNWINNRGSQTLVVAVDIPSGLFADSAELPECAVRAALTVTFTAPKQALVFPPARNLAGRVVVAPIGSPRALLETPGHRLELTDPELVRRTLPARPPESHKGSYGHVYVLAGSRGKSGAALMAGVGALRSGAGLVTLWLPAATAKDVAGAYPELMTEHLPETESGTVDPRCTPDFLASLARADALVAGPGLTTDPGTQELVRSVVRAASVPVVLDADGINAFAGRAEMLRNEQAQPVVITPHPGEMARLLGIRIPEVQSGRIEIARRTAHDQGCYVVLKGHQTLTATPDGSVFVNPTGNPGMATGGSGDILAGMIGRFVAGCSRRFGNSDPRALAEHIAAAVYLHGLAGDIAASRQGEESLTATDLPAFFPEAFRKATSDEAAREAPNLA